jgi:hypothetical protein
VPLINLSLRYDCTLTLEIGMFLFAKIVLENLYHQISAFDFKNELEAKNFPEGLDKAYVIVFDQPSFGD